jgi:hypothetical protein
MAEATSRAKLVDASRDFNGSGIGTRIPRSEVETALRSKKSPELFLDVARRDESGAEVETHRLMVTWDKDDLEQILRTTEGEEIELRFDRKELEEALEDDVEGHGIRERAMVLTVAATAAAGIAGAAQAAHLDAGGGSPPAAVEMISDAASGVQAPAQTPQMISDAASSVQATPQTPQMVSDSASSGVEATRPTDEHGALFAKADAERQPTELVSDSASGAGYGTQQSTELVSDAASGAGQATPEPTALISDSASSLSPTAHAAAEATPLVSDAGGGGAKAPPATELISDSASTGAQQPSSSGGGGVDISAPSPSTAGIAGGIALLITGAGFALRGQRRRAPRPT